MKSKWIMVSFFTSVLVILALLSNPIPSARANGTIPPEYSPTLLLNETYVYNVTEFGEDPAWWYVFSDKGFWETSTGGKIIVNFTGFYDRHPFDGGDVFPNDMPYLNLDVYNKTDSGLFLNFTQGNISNKEAAYALTLGYNDFQSAFLIPTDNWTEIKRLAIQEADPGGLYDLKGKVTVEETYNFFFVGFKENNGNQETQLIYDKEKGLLVWAKTKMTSGYKLELFLTNYTFGFGDLYSYNVSQFCNDPSWWWVFKDKGKWETSAGGLIKINFTGSYSRDPSDWGDVFPTNIPYMNIDVYDYSNSILLLNFTQSNISNKEVAYAMTIGYNDFQSGFLIPIMNNFTLVKELALQEANPGGPFDKEGTVNVLETNLTVEITFEQTGGDQRNYMIYEKRTGLLLWADVSITGYFLELKIEGFNPSIYETPQVSPPPEEPDDEEPELEKDESSSEPLLLVILMVSVIVVIISIVSGGVAIFSPKFKGKALKFAIIGMVGAISFTTLLFYNFGALSLSTPSEEEELGEPQEQVTDITLIVDYGDGTEKRMENVTLEGGKTTVFDLLDTYCDVKYDDYGDMGYLVTEIDGRKNGQNNWLYGVNGESIGFSSSKYNLKDGDEVNWVYGQSYSPP